MTADNPLILALNSSSSSIRFSLYQLGASLERRLHGKLDGIGLRTPLLTFCGVDGLPHERPCPAALDAPSAIKVLLDWFDTQQSFTSVSAIGHRLVHGTRHLEPETVTQDLLDELRRLACIHPDHLPREIELIEALAARRPTVPQVACFDTAFHRDVPRLAKQLTLPRWLDAQGVQRYDFHGLSYAFLMEELTRTAGLAAAQGRVILAHLGNGASMAAAKGGQSIDTSMGFTPTHGLPMRTRAGDSDLGLALYLEKTEHMRSRQLVDGVNQETSADMRDLLALEAADPRAAEAVALFCYQSKKCIGAYTATLGGLDTLVFSGGIGENAPSVRTRICEGLSFLGIALDETLNLASAEVISNDASPVCVRVIRADEELMIARLVCRAMGYTSASEAVQP